MANETNYMAQKWSITIFISFRHAKAQCKLLREFRMNKYEYMYE